MGKVFDMVLVVTVGHWKCLNQSLNITKALHIQAPICNAHEHECLMQRSPEQFIVTESWFLMYLGGFIKCFCSDRTHSSHTTHKLGSIILSSNIFLYRYCNCSLTLLGLTTKRRKRWHITMWTIAHLQLLLQHGTRHIQKERERERERAVHKRGSSLNLVVTNNWNSQEHLHHVYHALNK